MLIFGTVTGTRKAAVPNIVGLAVSTAQTTLSNLGLLYSDTGDTATTNSALNNTVYTQGTAAETVVLLGTTIGYNNYVFAFFSFFGFTPFGFTPFGFTPFAFTPFGFTPFGFTPFGFTPFGFTPFGFSPY